MSNLINAIDDGKLQKAKEILHSGSANIHAKDSDGWSALHFASRDGLVDIVPMLIERGANVDAQSNSGYTPLHLASRDGKIEAAKLLLQHGAIVNAKSNSDRTPLHDASYYGSAEVVELLLKNGANVNAQDNYGWAPLHEASSNGRAEVAELLLKNGADLKVTNKDGKTALEVAESSTWSKGCPAAAAAIKAFSSKLKAEDEAKERETDDSKLKAEDEAKEKYYSEKAETDDENFLVELLQPLGLVQYENYFKELGVLCMEDMDLLEKEDWENSQMNRIQILKVKKSLKKPKENPQVGLKDYAVFLSHFKDEAGEAARFLKERLDDLLVAEYQILECFLDCDNLHRLDTLLEYVKKSDNFLLILTKNVLTRPWCIVEITTAVEAGKRIVLVEVIHPDKHFDFNDIGRYISDYSNAPGVTPDCINKIKQCGMTIERVQMAISTVSNTIAKPLDLGRATKEVLNAQVKDIYKQFVFS